MIDTHKLSGVSYTLAVPGRRRYFLGVLLLACSLLMGAGLCYGWMSGQGGDNGQAREAALRQENQRLTQALEQAQLQIKHEVATRESLGRQLVEQSEEIKRLTGQLAFFQKNRRVPVGVK